MLNKQLIWSIIVKVDFSNTSTRGSSTLPEALKIEAEARE